MARSRPWYEEYDRWRDRALAYLRAYHAMSPDAPQLVEILSYSNLASMRLVFESNSIEGAGLSEGDTQKVIEANLSPGTDFIRLALGKLPVTDKSISEFFLSKMRLDRVRKRLKFEQRSRAVIEVLRHYQALYDTFRSLLEYSGRARLRHLMVYGTDPDVDRPIIEKNASKDVGEHPLITEDLIRRLHGRIAEGLIPPDAGVAAGQYRIDARSVGIDVSFPAPELVPASMKRFVESANTTLAAPDDPFMKAASITYDFLMIHPFPDFNGRVSRLLLALILYAAGAPFPVALRGTGNWKRRYLYALKRANRGKLDAYATLIARRVVESFEDIDANLVRAGLEPILPPSPAGVSD